MGLQFIGSGDFELTGNRFAERLQQYTGLHTGSKVLDIGCGIGRLARPLSHIIHPPGSYHGFDVVKVGIDWCNQNINTTYPHFVFTHVQLVNDLYTSNGQDAGSFAFPYPDASFDVVAAISVFTHLLPHETDRYLAETARVLEPGGKTYFTFFMRGEHDDLPQSFRFPVQHNGYALMNERVSRANVLYNQSFLYEMIARNGLEVQEWIKGRWNHAEGTDFQDTLILVKK